MPSSAIRRRNFKRKAKARERILVPVCRPPQGSSAPPGRTSTHRTGSSPDQPRTACKCKARKKKFVFRLRFRWILPVFLRIIFTKRAFSLKRLIKYEFRCLHNYYNFCPRTFLHYFFCVFIFELSMGFCKEITNFCGSRTIIN